MFGFDAMTRARDIGEAWALRAAPGERDLARAMMHREGDASPEVTAEVLALDVGDYPGLASALSDAGLTPRSPGEYLLDRSDLCAHGFMAGAVAGYRQALDDPDARDWEENRRQAAAARAYGHLQDAQPFELAAVQWAMELEE